MAPITVIQGPAGTGKSVLLNHIASHARRDRLVSITSVDQLAAHVDKLAPDAKAPAQLVLIDSVANADELTDTLLPSALYGTTRIVIASRVPVTSVTASMVLGGNALIVSTQDLLFTAEEIAALAARLKVAIAAEDAAELHQVTDGWAAMVYAALRTRNPEATITQRRLQEVVDRFVRDELLSAIPPRDLAMLTDAAAIPRFDTSVLRTVVSDHVGTDVNAPQLIDQWAAHGWIIHDPVLDGHWRIPQPIRQNLLAELEVKHPGRRVELTTRAARLLVATRRTTEALPYLVDASLNQVVAGVLRDRWGDDVASSGQFFEAGPAIRSLADETLADDPSLLLIAAVSALRAPPDIDTFASRLAQAESVLDRESFNGPAVTSYSLRMMLARIRGNIHEANAIEKLGQAHIDAASDDERREYVGRIVFFTYQVGDSRLAEGRLHEAEAALRAARTMARNNRGDWYAAISARSAAYAAFLRGSLTDAHRDTESVRAFAQPRSDTALMAHVRLTLAMLDLEYGRTWEVPDMLAQAHAMLETDAEPHAARLALAWSVLGLMSADPGAAEQALLLCDPSYSTNQLPLNCYLATVARAHAYLVIDDPKAALHELDETVAVPPGHAALLAVTRTRAYLALNDLHAAGMELSAYESADSSIPLTVRADLLALAAEWALRQGLEAQRPFRRLLAFLERTGARRPVLLLPSLREAVLTGRLAAPYSSPLAGLGVEIAALVRCNEAGPPKLSDREEEVLTALAGPDTLASIATNMYVSANTLKTMTRGLYRKLGVADRHEAVRVARALGIRP